MIMQCEAIEDLLGLELAHGSRLEFADAVEKGLPTSALERLASAMAPGKASFKFRFVPKATLERRKRTTDKLLSREESNRIARVAKVFAFAEEIYGTRSDARAFLMRPHIMLDGKKPLDVALATDPGSDVVTNILGRIACSAAI